MFTSFCLQSEHVKYPSSSRALILFAPMHMYDWLIISKRARQQKMLQKTAILKANKRELQIYLGHNRAKD